MDKLEILFANNRAVICFYLSIIGILVLYSRTMDIHMRQVFCLSRKRNMEYVRKHGMISSLCFAVVEITLYEILSFLRGYAHITPVLAGFFFAGSACVVFWTNHCMVVKDVGRVLVGLFILISMPFIIMILIVKCNIEFDRYLGYVAVVLMLLTAVQYIGFVNGWKKGDLA